MPINVLIVTYVFPPYAAVGVYRILKFCKYFPEFGLTPVILTPKHPNVVSKDEGLLDSVSNDIAICRTVSCEPFRMKSDKSPPTQSNSQSSASGQFHVSSETIVRKLKRIIRQELSVPDASFLWSWGGLAQGLKAVRRYKIDIVLSSAPPQSVHLLAARIARVMSVPHVVDFRDLWTQNTSYNERNLSPRLAARDRRMEEFVLRRASGVTVNTESFRHQLLDKNQYLDPSSIEVVTNGVDPDDFGSFVGERPQSKKFTLLYSGSLYGAHRNPEFFFRAVKQLVENRPEVGQELRLLFIGNWTEQYTELVDSCGVSDQVEVLGWMPQRKVLNEVFGADLLLLIQGFDPALSAAVPRKLYEYMISGRPILGFAPEGEIPKLINQYDCGVCFNNPAIQPIVDYLSTAIDRWRTERVTGQARKSELRVMPELESKTQVKRAARFYKEVLARRSR